jgi:hypothetical protein
MVCIGRDVSRTRKSEFFCHASCGEIVKKRPSSLVSAVDIPETASACDTFFLLEIRDAEYPSILFN